ncbi:MAG: 9-O-acetylesterase [Tannerella sp.]|jgi:sialate O-acetylesterase|nr:9-O-acetylesterase [Tannerella sp.]
MKKNLFLICFVFIVSGLFAEVKLPHIFSDNMVIQQNEPVKIRGLADRNETVEVHFAGQAKKVKADRSGNWTVTLNPVQYGGPYTMEIKGKTNTVTLTNILVGEVWICSGQSNMEWVVNNSDHAAKEIAEANYPMIRSFNVVKNVSMQPLNDLDGEWTVCSPATVPAYTAAGYFFARKLHEETGIPIGIINSSWGGTDIETWTGAGAFNTLPQAFKDRYNNVKIAGDFNTFATENAAKKKRFLEALENEPGLKERWYELSDLSSWKSAGVPKQWSQSGMGDVDGIIWYAVETELPASVAGSRAELHLGAIDDRDITWVNGVKVGETNSYSEKRRYGIPAGVLKEGKNRITVRVHDTGGDGGIWGDADELFLEAGNRQYPLAGSWKYREAVTSKQFDYIDVSPNMYPSLLYNAMIHPLISFPVKGAIWYQGENNAGQASHYRTLFPLMINDWRSKWGKELSFYWVQLANFMAKDEAPANSNWAELREAQTMTLSLPGTGQAVIIDIGDAKDIHPRNKQDVGLRLALHALHKDYGFGDLTCTSPMFKSMEIRDNKAIITFDNAGEGLCLHNKYGYVEGFAIAGSDRQFYWAKGSVDGDRVILESDRVKKPVAVRYGWSNNPDINLYNKAGLPATPFRTDDWK